MVEKPDFYKNTGGPMTEIDGLIFSTIHELIDAVNSNTEQVQELKNHFHESVDGGEETTLPMYYTKQPEQQGCVCAAVKADLVGVFEMEPTTVKYYGELIRKILSRHFGVEYHGLYNREPAPGNEIGDCDSCKHLYKDCPSCDYEPAPEAEKPRRMEGPGTLEHDECGDCRANGCKPVDTKADEAQGMEDYKDIYGNPISLEKLIKQEPAWAASRIRESRKTDKALIAAEAEVTRLNGVLANSTYNKRMDELEAEVERLKGELRECHKNAECVSEAAKEWERTYYAVEKDAAALRAKVEAVLRMGTPWPLESVLNHLVDAIDHLFDDHSCDANHHEVWKAARNQAQEIIAIIATPDAKTEGEG
jgi:hypothetical protein